LAERTLARLRKLASGNGMEPAAIVLLETQEQVFTLKGKMEVSPLCESESVTYPGGVPGAGRKTVATVAALQEAVAKHKKDFRENPDWISATTQEIKSHDGQGWGLENAKVTLPEKVAIYASTGICPSCSGRQMLTCAQCNGQGTVICTQCQGRGREICYHCSGSGENLQQPGQPCLTCNGTRFAPCRFCQTHGHLPCPTCNGKRGTACGTCRATGKITNEVTVTCGAETHFQLQAEGLPTGLRRGLDRIGIANLGKGHADVTASEPPEEEREESLDKPQIPILHYSVALPYAEMRMSFGNKKAVVSAVGKRCALLGIPNFLDTALQPWRDKLHRLALDEAIEARALKEILSLTVAGKGRLNEIRKLYPLGLSPEAIESIVADMQAALNKTTLKTRAVIAALCGIVSTMFFYFLFVAGFEILLTRNWSRFAEAAIDIGLLAATLGASWACLNFSTRFVLKKRFPQLTLSLKQKIGNTGFGMLGTIILLFVLCMTLAPMKPLWLAAFVH
jgi:hypothetical protein